jgi:hypothetical protein
MRLRPANGGVAPLKGALAGSAELEQPITNPSSDGFTNPRCSASEALKPRCILHNPNLLAIITLLRIPKVPGLTAGNEDSWRQA